jgi:hypothetical protein
MFLNILTEKNLQNLEFNFTIFPLAFKKRVYSRARHPKSMLRAGREFKPGAEGIRFRKPWMRGCWLAESIFTFMLA